MAKMIDAQALSEELVYMRADMKRDTVSVQKVLDYLRNNAIEAEPVRWSEYRDIGGAKPCWMCARCGVAIGGFSIRKYCPNCGAKMG